MKLTSTSRLRHALVLGSAAVFVASAYVQVAFQDALSPVALLASLLAFALAASWGKRSARGAEVASWVPYVPGI